MERLLEIVGEAVAVVLIILALALLMAVPTMLLINYIFSAEFKVWAFGGPIGFWKAFWLNFLVGFLLSLRSSSKKK